MARREVCPTDFYCTKACARDRELSIGAIFNVIAAVVHELCVSNKQNNKKNKKNKKTKWAILTVSVLDVRMIPK